MKRTVLRIDAAGNRTLVEEEIPAEEQAEILAALQESERFAEPTSEEEPT